jgi:hypothetical protein
MKHLSFVAVALLVVVSTLGCASSGGSGSAAEREASGADQPLPTARPDDSAEDAFQRRVGPYTDRLLRALRGSGQYAGEDFQRARGRLVLYGVGDPTPEVAALIEQAPDDLDVAWRSAPYTSAELDREVRRLMQRHPQLNTGSPRGTATGLVFTTNDRDLLEAADPQQRLSTRYPVTIHRGEPPTPLLGDEPGDG